MANAVTTTFKSGSFSRCCFRWCIIMHFLHPVFVFHIIHILSLLRTVHYNAFQAGSMHFFQFHLVFVFVFHLCFSLNFPFKSGSFTHPLLHYNGRKFHPFLPSCVSHLFVFNFLAELEFQVCIFAEINSPQVN